MARDTADGARPPFSRKRKEACVCVCVCATKRDIGFREKGGRVHSSSFFPNVSFSPAFFRIHERVLPVTVIGFKGWFIKTGSGGGVITIVADARLEIFRRCNAALWQIPRDPFPCNDTNTW